MAEICRICLESKKNLHTNVLDFVDTIENLVEIEVNVICHAIFFFF